MVRFIDRKIENVFAGRDRSSFFRRDDEQPAGPKPEAQGAPDEENNSPATEA